jgi:hypothetical protein
VSVLFFLFFACCAASGPVARYYSDRSERARRVVRGIYTNTASSIWLRNSVPISPIWGPPTLLLASLALLPRSIAAWGLLPVFGAYAIAFVAAYRVPAPLMPGWLAQEIASGKTLVARPDRGDWILLCVALPVVIGAMICVPSSFLDRRLPGSRARRPRRLPPCGA